MLVLDVCSTGRHYMAVSHLLIKGQRWRVAAGLHASSCCSGDSPQSSSDDDETDQELEDFDEDEEEELSFISSALMEDGGLQKGTNALDY